MDQELKSKLNSLSPQQLKELMKKMGKEKKELPLMPRNKAQQYPVSSAQKRMWFLSKLDPGSHLYTNPIGIRIKTKSSLDIDLYVHGFRRIVQRHEIMRTSFVSEDGRVLQQIHDEVPVHIEKIDLRAHPEEQRQQMADEILAQDGRTPIDIESFPLFKFRLLMLSDSDFVLLYTSHHIISDAWSSAHIFREMQEVYEQSLAGKDIPTTPLKYQFVDYVHWEQNWLNSDEYKQTLAKWNKLLPAAPEPLNLPSDYVRPPVIHYEGGLEKATLSPDLVERLSEFSKKEGVNLFHTLLATFNVLLHHYSGNEEIVVGIPLANRKIREFQQTVGMFLNTLPHRSLIDDKLSFTDYLQQVKAVSQDIVVHQDFPFEKLIEEVRPPRDLAVSPIFQVLFVFQNIPDMYQWGDLDVAPVKPDYHISKYELNLWVEEVAGSLFLSMTYQKSLFNGETVRRFLEYYEVLLAIVTAQAALPISQLKPYPAETPALQTLPPVEGTYLSAFETLAATQTEAPALTYDNSRYAYAALNEQANKLAHYLMRQGKPGQIVAFLLPRSAQQIISILAIHKAGCAYLPIDPAINQERLAALLNDSGATQVITEASFTSLFADKRLPLVFIDTAKSEIASCSGNNPDVPVRPDDLAYILYTSGTTGASKGVRIGHAQLFNYAQAIWKRLQLEATDRFASISGITTDLGNTQIFPALMHGASIDMIPDAYMTHPSALAEYIQAHEIDCLKIVPSHLASLLHAQEAASLLPRKLLILGGEKVSAALVQQIRECRKDLRILNHYGPTETTIGILTHEIGPVADNSIIPLGTPLDNNEVFIVDAQQRILPDGMPGEIVVCGHNVGQGYHGNEAQTSAAFVAGIAGVGRRCYKTGDLGRRRPDGNIEFLGRKDRQVKVRGFRVEPEAIERALLSNPQIAQAVVTDKDGRSLVAYITWKGTAAPDTAILKQDLRSGLPAHMIPEEIVVVPEIPRHSNGKIDIRSLKNYKDTDTGKSTVRIIVPRDENELAVARIWQEILRPERISITDNFFDAGGTSLIAIEFIARINRHFDTDLGIGVLFEHNTIQSLAALVGNGQYTSDNHSLVLLRKGNTDQSVFLAHPAGGDVLSYYELAGHIDSNCQVYGLQSKDFSRADESIEALAHRYLEAIRQEVPGGRYVFGGWSMGACVAFEMARQWQTATGNTVPVVMLDQQAPVPHQDAAREAITELDRQIAFGGKIGLLTGRRNNLNRGSLEPLSKADRTALFLETFKESRLVPDDLRPEQFQGFLDKMMEHHDITARYAAGPYTGKVLLVCAEETIAAEEGYGWRRYATNSLETVRVPGNHVSIIRSPFAQATAEQINQLLTTITSTAADLQHAPA